MNGRVACESSSRRRGHGQGSRKLKDVQEVQVNRLIADAFAESAWECPKAGHPEKPGRNFEIPLKTAVPVIPGEVLNGAGNRVRAGAVLQDPRRSGQALQAHQVLFPEHFAS